MNGQTRQWASGAGMLVVKRGPNAGSQFRLDRAVVSAGRRHAEFRREEGEFHVVDLGSLNKRR
jgi:pSer/pThr/pTyr-binding forkhead associated (FHA) protein